MLKFFGSLNYIHVIEDKLESKSYKIYFYGLWYGF